MVYPKGTKCIVCKKLLTDDDRLYTARLCEIGVVCKLCYPKYRIVRDKLREHYNKIIEQKLSNVTLLR